MKKTAAILLAIMTALFAFAASAETVSISVPSPGASYSLSESGGTYTITPKDDTGSAYAQQMTITQYESVSASDRKSAALKELKGSFSSVTAYSRSVKIFGSIDAIFITANDAVSDEIPFTDVYIADNGLGGCIEVRIRYSSLTATGFASDMCALLSSITAE
ncbi:MAG: hypothetical protein PHI27_03305 [Eubacteriales bacterium]|nr:hypothetical protein [Eubacteriales bacterium]MDD3881264.1 hypothetical protein [Eubacteriales bacterium]MDD4512182.1 hypothetical protein [Eubacteriales bacterium]